MLVSSRESEPYEDAVVAILAVVEWHTIRAAFIRERGTRTQAEIAEPVGLKQNAISKLEANDNLGPAVGTFVKAVLGLGMPVSKFFAQIEGLRTTELLHQDVKSPMESALDTTPKSSLPPVQATDKARALRFLEEQIRSAQIAREAIAKFPVTEDLPEGEGQHDEDDRHPASLRAAAAERGTTGRGVRRRAVRRAKTRRPRDRKR